MRLHVEHTTVYRYASPVAYSVQYLRLTPRSGPRQTVIDWQLALPGPAQYCTDAWGNVLHVLTLDHPHAEISIHAHGAVETEGDGLQAEDDGLPPLLFLRETSLTGADAAIRDFAQTFQQAIDQDRQAGLGLMMEGLLERMPYEGGSTEVATCAAEAFAGGRGVCQDHTQVFVAACRSLGLPARYVSGYLYTGDSTHVASHAWAEVWLGQGWLGFDISNQRHPGMGHLKLAIGLDYLDACPIRGVRRGGGQEAMQAVARVSQAEQ